MLICRVTGLLVSTIKDRSLQSTKLLLVEELHRNAGKDARRFVAVDTVGAGEGEVVIVATGEAARRTERTREMSVDAAVIGIVDSFPEAQNTGKSSS